MATLPPSPFTALPASSAETLVVAPGPQAPVVAASGPFDSGNPVALLPDEAAACASSHAPGAAADICEPTTDGGGPQGSPAPGQELIGAGDLEATDCIGEIFTGARKLNQLPGIFDPAAITGRDELLYVTLKLMDDPHTRDLPCIPDEDAFMAAIEPLPLFLQAAQ